MVRRLLILGLLPALLIFAVACGGDSDDDGGDEPTATEEAMDDASATPTEEAMDDPTATPTEEMMADGGPLAAVNGVTCTGDWTNLTFGSTGSFEAAFTANEAGDEGTVSILLGGNVFGAAPEDTAIELPLTVDGDAVVVSSEAGRLGTAELSFDSDGGATSAVFEAPPAFNNEASKATLQDFAFDGETLTTTIEIDFGDGSAPATSEIDSVCG